MLRELGLTRIPKQMSEPTPAEIKECLSQLKEYQKRLKSEVTLAAQKLQMPAQKIESTLNSNSELDNLEKIINHLQAKRKSN
tara:strand:+ start:6731 stop:6976 length:246 start_codon:yes stop_codon:yes gene_type:complete